MIWYDGLRYGERRDQSQQNTVDIGAATVSRTPLYSQHLFERVVHVPGGSGDVARHRGRTTLLEADKLSTKLKHNALGFEDHQHRLSVAAARTHFVQQESSPYINSR